MQTAEEMAMWQSVFAAAENTALTTAAVDAVNSFTLAKMREDGFYRRIMRETAVHTRGEWLAMGVPPEQLIEYEGTIYVDETRSYEDGTVVDAVWNDGVYLRELIQARTRRLDYRRRLALKQVGKAEFEREDRVRRRLERDARVYPTPRWTGEQKEEFAYTLVCELLAMIAALAERNSSG